MMTSKRKNIGFYDWIQDINVASPIKSSISKWIPHRALCSEHFVALLMVSWVGLQCVIVVFPDYTHD